MFDTDNEEFKKKNILFKITNILGNKNAAALIIDVSSATVSLQEEVYKKWISSSNSNVRYLIFVSSGNKNGQLGLDRYQFGQINVYIKNNTKNPFPVNFEVLLQISNKSHNLLLNYLKTEIEKILGKTVYQPSGQVLR